MKKIKNVPMLLQNQLRKDALEIIEAGLQAIDTKAVIRRTVTWSGNSLVVQGKEFILKPTSRLVVVGVGKCSLDAAQALEHALGSRLSGGMICDVRSGKLDTIQSYCGDHPFPSQRNVHVTEKMIHLLKSLTKDDVVLFIISGGGSTLLCQPKDLTCLDEKAIVRCLYQSGATIQEVNTVRKHLSVARGGYLAKYACPAIGINLIFSDVVGGDLQYIASGPTVRDTSTVAEAARVLNKFYVQKRCGLNSLKLVETPKNKRYFQNMHYFLVASNTIALAAMEQTACQKGYHAKICTSCLTGDAKDVGFRIVCELQQSPPRTVLLYGGETTVTIPGKTHGKGGRNLELALVALGELQKNQLVVSVASDGHDNSSYAGGIADYVTQQRAKKQELESRHFLDQHDSWHFFKRTESYLRTGKTGSNVADLVVAMKE